MSILVGLTGNIGAGKTLAASYFNELGAYIIDADQISRRLVSPYQPAWKEIVEEFGSNYLNYDKTLNRSKLGFDVFRDDTKKNALENILHPRVIAEEKKIYLDHQKNNPKAIVLIDSPLLIESKNFKNVDKVIIVQSTPELQVQRVMKRDGESSSSVEDRLNSQMSLEEKLKYADYILYNTSGLDHLKCQVKSLYTEIRNLA